MKPQIRKQIGACNQPEKFVVIHHNSDPAAVEHAQQVCNFRVWRQGFQPVGHRFFHGIVKMRRIAMNFYQQVGLVDNADGATVLIDNRKL